MSGGPASSRGRSRRRPGQGSLRRAQAGVWVLDVVVWHVRTVPGIVSPEYFEAATKAAFFLGEPLKVLARFW